MARPGATHRGWHWDDVNTRLDVYVDGTKVAYFNDSSPYLTLASGLTITAGGLTVIAGGATITAGGLTVTAGATSIQDTLTVGVDDTGHDVKFFGATTGKYMLWDESADKLIVVGTADLGTSCEADAYTVGGTAGADFGPAGVTSITVVKGIVTAIS